MDLGIRLGTVPLLHHLCIGSRHPVFWSLTSPPWRQCFLWLLTAIHHNPNIYKSQYNMALVTEFQGGKTMFILLCLTDEENRLREGRCLAWGHPAGQGWPSLAHPEATTPWSSHLRFLVKLFSFPQRRLYTHGGDPKSPLRKAFWVPVPFFFLCFIHRTLCFGFGLKIRVLEIGQVRQIHSYPLMLRVPEEINQDLDLNLLGQHRHEDAFQYAIGSDA